MSNALSDDTLRGGQWLSRFLDMNGDSTGSIEMNVDGSSTPVHFLWYVPEGYVFWLYRILITYRDNGSFDSDLYGNGPALTSGIDFGTTIDDVFVPATQQVNIKSNQDWASYAHDVVYKDAQGQGDAAASIRYSFSRDGIPVKFVSGEAFTVVINDNMTNLNSQRLRMGGILVKRDPHAPTLPWQLTE